jgi:N-acetyl-gamma-glutamylphosphate reductase
VLCLQLALYPLLKSKLILPDDIIIDAKSGEPPEGSGVPHKKQYMGPACVAKQLSGTRTHTSASI